MLTAAVFLVCGLINLVARRRVVRSAIVTAYAMGFLVHSSYTSWLSDARPALHMAVMMPAAVLFWILVIGALISFFARRPLANSGRLSLMLLLGYLIVAGIGCAIYARSKGELGLGSGLSAFFLLALGLLGPCLLSWDIWVRFRLKKRQLEERPVTEVAETFS